MRLIDADALKDLIYESWGGDPAYHTARYGQLKTETEAKAEYDCLMLENIDSAPTIGAVPLEDYRSMEQTVYKLTQALAEAEPTKHGRWIDAGDSKLQCTSCHRYIRRIVPIGYDYCPYCGARMQSTMGQVKSQEAVNNKGDNQ